MLHLVNYHGDQPARNVGVRLRLPAGRRANSVILASPEHAADQQLAFREQEGMVPFTVPEVRVYEIAVVSTGVLGLDGGAQAESPFTLATVPRIDVHTHIGNTWKALDEVMALRQAIHEQLHADMARSFSLGSAEPPDMTELRKRYQGRIQFCISDYTIKDGLRFSPQELVEWQNRGVVGFKFYPGWQRGVQIDQAANDPAFDNAMRIYPHIAESLTQLGCFGKEGSEKAAHP
jgi:hypothetical protein